MKIGILGSSFNPPHKGHLEISNRALATFSLNEVWWLITKVNPLKNSSDYIPLNERKNKIDEMNINPLDLAFSFSSNPGLINFQNS